MSTTIAARIEKWFSTHESDGEFTLHERAVPYSLIGPNAAGAHWLITTKPAAVLAQTGDAEVPQDFALLGGYGLPHVKDTNWIRKLVRPNGLSFLGDMDPVDLMIYAWLRARLRPLRITYLGIGDALLRALVPKSKVSNYVLIPLTSAERDAVDLVWQVIPDLSKTVGIQCARWLKAGSKLELESVLSMSPPKSVILQLRKCQGGKPD